MYIELQLSHKYIKYDNDVNMIFFNEMYKNHGKKN